MDTSSPLTVSVHKHANAQNLIKGAVVSDYCLCLNTGGPNSKEESRGDMAGLKRTYDMMEVGISRVPPIRDSLSAAEGEHKTPFFNKHVQQSFTVYPFSS